MKRRSKGPSLVRPEHLWRAFWEGDDRVSRVSLIAANLLPLFGALFLGWDASVIILLYWAENLIAGFYNVLRMALVSVKPKPPAAHLAKLFMIPLFCVHFGGFCAVHGVFLLSFFRLANPPRAASDFDAWPCFLIFIGLLVWVVWQLFQNMPVGMIWPLAALFVSHGISFVENYLVRGEYRRSRLDRLMGRPYARMVVLHVAILLGGGFVAALGSPVPLLAILVLLKLCLDLYHHQRSHRSTGTGSRQRWPAGEIET